MPQDKGLFEIWSAEIDRITPKSSPVDLSDIIYIITAWIQKMIKKIFGADVNISPPEEKTVITVSIILLAVFIFFVVCILWRKYRPEIRGLFIKLMKPGDLLARKKYFGFLSMKNYTAAFRFVVMEISRRTGLTGRTFCELFGYTPQKIVSDIGKSYGKAVHCNEAISKNELLQLETLASDQFPEIIPVIKKAARTIVNGRTDKITA